MKFNRNYITNITIIIAINPAEILILIVKTESVNYLDFHTLSEVPCDIEIKGEKLSPSETAKKF